MPVLIQPQPWTEQPQYPRPVNPKFGLYSAHTAVLGTASSLRTVLGPAFAATNPGVMSPAVTGVGQAIFSNSTGYFSRANSLSSGGLTIGFTYTPSSVGSQNGILSWGSTSISSTPFLLVQSNNADLRVLIGGAYQITYSSVLVTGVPYKIIVSSTNIANSAASTVYLGFNGQLKSASVANNGTNAKTTEFLGTGYNGISGGYFGDFFSANICYPPEVLVSLSNNPWQIFAP